MYSGIFFLLFTVFGWGIMYSSSKVAVDAGIDGYYLSVIRYGFGTIFVAILLFLSEGISSFKYEGNFKKLWIYGTIGFAGLNLFTFVGVSLSNAEHATIIFALLPMIGIFINWLFEGIKPKKYTLILSIISFIGIIFIVTKLNFDVIVTNSFIGDILLLLATVSWALYTYYIRDFSHWSALRATALSSMPGTLSIFLIVAILTKFHIATLPLLTTVKSVSIPIIILVLTTGLIVTWNAGIKKLGLINGILFVNLVPVVTFYIGYIQGNKITNIEIIGALLILFSLLINNLLSRKYKKSI